MYGIAIWWHFFKTYKAIFLNRIQLYTTIMSLRAISYITISFLLFAILVSGCNKQENLDWVTENGYKWKEIHKDFSFFDEVGFEEVTHNSGINFTNRITKEQVSTNRVLINGSGTAVGDIDGDGLVDIYFAAIEGPNKLYRNLGNWKFENITGSAGIAMADEYSAGVAFADLDSDDDLDLIVSTIGGGNKVFLNDGNGNFKESIGALETEEKYGSHSIAIADIDKDGDLDIYITNYKIRSAKDIYPNERGYGDIVKREGDNYSIQPKFQNHYRLEERGEFILWFEMGEPDLLFLNEGDGTFKNVSESKEIFEDVDGSSVSLRDLKDWGLHAKFFDLNNDMYPDLYVCNDFESPDRIWINKGDGTFKAIDKTAIRNTSLSSMSVDFTDIDKDGNTDAFIAEMLARNRQKRVRDLGTMIPLPEPVGVIENRPQYVGNTMLLNRGDLTFANITDYAGLRGSDWTWGSKFLDIDLDGYEDLILTNGNYYDSQDLDANNRLQNLIQRGQIDPEDVMLEYPNLDQVNFIFKNNGDLTFTDKSEDWGFTTRDISQGIAMADFDNDGDQDMVINRLNGKAGLFQNKVRANRIAIKLVGDSANTRAIGSKIKVSSDEESQVQEVVAGGSYLSGSDQTYTFAALSDTMTLDITWYDGKVSSINGLKKNRIYVFEKSELSAADELHIAQSKGNLLFSDQSQLLRHKHHEMYYDDFENKQHLLPYRLSQPGPGLSWSDINNDGYDDLVIGTGKGGKLSIFINRDGKNFEEISPEDSALLRVQSNDAASILVLPAARQKNMLSAIYNYESEAEHAEIRSFEISPLNSFTQTSSLKLPAPVAIGPLASADYDKDGTLDLFAGGRTEAGKFPAQAASWLLKNRNFSYSVDEENLLGKPGLVTGAVFSDINSDGWPDLLLSRDWNSLQLFINEQGKFVDRTEQWGLGSYRGLWRGITTGDFNNDGRMDIVAGNMGENNMYKNLIDESKKDIKLFYYSRTKIGSSIIESYYSPELGGWTPLRRLTGLAKEFSILSRNIENHNQYSNSTIEDLFGISLDNFNSVSVNTLSSMIFINEGNSFKANALPWKAQLTSVQGLSVSDFNADGNEDLVLSQNFFGYPVEKSRSDAGRGLLLLGDGKGGFKVVEGHESGIEAYGEQRAVAISDFNRDSRSDLVITQNGSETLLYQNNNMKQGIVVKLSYNDSNPQGIGARLRFTYKDGTSGPVRELKLGEGYLSQSSATHVIGYKNYPESLTINWPNGVKNQVDLPSDLLMLHVNSTGEIIDRKTRSEK